MIVQFDLRLPESGQQLALANEKERAETSQDRMHAIQQARKDIQTRPAVTHTWLNIEWYKPVGGASTEVDARQLAMAPTFYQDRLYDNAVYRWLPVQLVLGRFAPLFTGTPSARTFSVCLLPRKVSLS